MAKLNFIAPYVYPLGLDALIEGVSRASGNLKSKVKDLIINNSRACITEKLGELLQHLAIPLNRKEYVAAVALKENQNSEKQLVREVRISQQAIERLLTSFSVASEHNLAVQDKLLLELMLWQMAIHLQVAKVVRLSSNPTVIFLGGGGGETEFYKYTISATHPAFNQKCAGVIPYAVDSIPAPASQDFTMNGIDSKHFHRFSIAYGLSIPAPEMPRYSLPRIEDTRSHPDSGSQVEFLS
ncbi:MAG: hypothetical protein JO235_04020 [Chroococcidiopsidaceae cyanobacterium CP_BM_RX_35]|nr:hypothetical protein [Chroococcidiopsidaceae cyanobacterium CP_BM_RX_35]